MSSSHNRPDSPTALRSQLTLLHSQLQSKLIQNRNLTQKCQIQAKRIKFLKKEVDQYKLKQSRLQESEHKAITEYKTMKQSNRKLKQMVNDLTKRLEEMQVTGGGTGGVVTIGEKVVQNNTDEIDLASEGVTDEEIKLLVGNKKLRNLILGDNSISDLGAQLICDNLPHLTKLFLNKNSISDAGLTSIGNLKELKYLDLRYNKLTSAACKFISQLTTVTQLSLSNNQLDDSATEEIKKMKQLKYLDLTSNMITGKSVEGLVELKELTHLYLSSNRLREEDMRGLMEGLQGLAVADFRFNGLKEEEKERLRGKKREDMQLFV